MLRGRIMNQPPLGAIYEGWEVYQRYLITAVAPLTAEQLQLRAAPTLRPIHDLVTHIIATRVGWFHRAAGAGSQDIEPLDHWDEEGAPMRTAAELVSGLEASWHLVKEALAVWTPDELQRPFEVTRGARTR